MAVSARHWQGSGNASLEPLPPPTPPSPPPAAGTNPLLNPAGQALSPEPLSLGMQTCLQPAAAAREGSRREGSAQRKITGSGPANTGAHSCL